MNTSLVSFCLAFLFGVILSLLGGILVKVFADRASIGGVQVAFLWGVFIDVHSFWRFFYFYK